MKLQIETSSYNERRYGKPWIAKVDFVTDKKGAFHFGDWIGATGSSGLLELDCEPGDVVARGQKDTRKPVNSTPDYYIVQEDGSLDWVKKVDAYKHFLSRKAETKPDWYEIIMLMKMELEGYDDSNPVLEKVYKFLESKGY